MRLPTRRKRDPKKKKKIKRRQKSKYDIGEAGGSDASQAKGRNGL